MMHLMMINREHSHTFFCLKSYCMAIPKCMLHPQIDSKNKYICMICDIFNTKVTSSRALIKKQGLNWYCFKHTELVPLILALNSQTTCRCKCSLENHKLRPLIDYLSSVAWLRSYKISLHSNQISSVKIVKGMSKI